MAFLFLGVAGNIAYMGATNSRPGVQQLTAGLRTEEKDHGSLSSLFVTGLLARGRLPTPCRLAVPAEHAARLLAKLKRLRPVFRSGWARHLRRGLHGRPVRLPLPRGAPSPARAISLAPLRPFAFHAADEPLPAPFRRPPQVVGKQLTEGQFLDGIAVVNVVPTPLVMFITWDGFVAKGISGAIVMTIGIFLPCFSFVVLFHRLFMWLTDNKHFASFIDGVSAAVMGIIAETVCQLTLAAIHTGAQFRDAARCFSPSTPRARPPHCRLTSASPPP